MLVQQVPTPKITVCSILSTLSPEIKKNVLLTTFTFLRLFFVLIILDLQFCIHIFHFSLFHNFFLQMHKKHNILLCLAYFLIALTNSLKTSKIASQTSGTKCDIDCLDILNVYVKLVKESPLARKRRVAADLSDGKIV
jgi:hypothetical protein